MSLEDSINSLIDTIDETNAILTAIHMEMENLRGLIELQSGIEAGELEKHGVPDIPMWFQKMNMTEVITTEEKTKYPDFAEEMTKDPEPFEPVSPQNQKVVELISLAKEMGHDYLLNDDGRLVVDNRVLDEYNRRRMSDEV